METQFHLTTALTTVLLFATAAVSATVQFSQFQDAGLDNRRFVDNVLFVTPSVRSRLDCARRCATDPGCVTFTYSGQGSSGPGSCRGHSTQTEAGDAHNAEDGAKTYCRLSEPSPDLPDACISGNYTELDDHKRDVNNMHDEYLCDRDSLVPGWYRFLVNGTSASMPTDCPPVSRCGTTAPMWLDLQSAMLPAAGQELQARACAAYSGDCCHSDWDRPVTVRNCGSFYIYDLQPPRVCNLRYCAERDN